jgi:hypothetical protein
MQPGDRVIWLSSPGRSFLTGWRVRAIPGVIVKVCRHLITIRVTLRGHDRKVNVHPDNLICDDEADNSARLLTSKSR